MRRESKWQSRINGADFFIYTLQLFYISAIYIFVVNAHRIGFYSALIEIEFEPMKVIANQRLRVEGDVPSTHVEALVG